VLKKSQILILIVSLLMLTCAISGGTVFAQVAATKAQAASNSAAAQQADRGTVLAASESILQEVSQMRGLPAKNPVKSGFKSHSELESIIVKDLDEDHTAEETASQVKLLARLGMVPSGFAMRTEMIKLLGEQIGGFYEPRTGEFYLVDWLDLDEQKPVMAHELTHAIQDQNFNLKRFDKWAKDEGDQDLAIHALIEGEATVVMINYMLKGQGLDITRVPLPLTSILDVASKTDDNRFPVLANTPRVIRETLEFPYLYGAAFVQQIVHDSSWQKIADLYTTELPESTEQIMHPEKMLNHEHPVKVKLPDISAQLGAGWRKSEVNVQGEFGYLLVLSQFLDKETARVAAAGWGGDQFVCYDRADNNDTVLTQLANWDTERDAIEFFQAYADRTLKRYKDAKPVINEAKLKTYTTEEGMALIEQRGQDVLIIEGASPEQLNSLRELLWQQHTEKKADPASPAPQKPTEAKAAQN
jgi:hypothetical protein